ncbi:MAG: helix-turn-helix domain-containing protein, partial [Acidobacteria bacterium]|nr:helix-turn-helix domain-containing protein [Acidobacteriota bacterium]
AEHLGASPAQIVRTRRVHFARRLLDETALPVTRIAFEAGFGSLRAFHTAYKESFGEPPKASRAAETPKEAGRLLTLRLPYRPPFDWNAILGFLAARAVPGIEEVVDGAYRRTFAGTTLSVRPAASGFALALSLTPPGEGRLLGIVRTVSRVFDLGADPETLRRHFESDAVLGPLVAKRPGLRVPGAFSRFELLVRAVLGQQVSVAAARTFAGRIVARWGTPLPGAESALTHAFPEAPVLAALAPADLASIGLTTRRAETLRAVARAFADGALPEESPGLDELVERLTELPGIGPWTAQYMALRAWNEPDAFPTGDLGLLAALAKDGVRPGAKELEARAEAWRPFRAYAALHLWTEGAPE